jgi:hypothetical protein
MLVPTATSFSAQETTVGTSWLQPAFDAVIKATGLEKLTSQTAALYVLPVLFTVAVTVRFGSPTLMSVPLVAEFTAAMLDVMVVLVPGAAILSCVRPTLAFTGVPLIVAAPLMVMLFTVAGVVAPLASNTTTTLVDAPFTVTVADGEKIQETPAGRFPQLSVTAPAKFTGVIWTVTGGEKELLTMLTVAGDGVPKEKLGAGTLRVRGRVWAPAAPFRVPVAVMVRLGLPPLVLRGTETVSDGLEGNVVMTLVGEK